MLKPAERLSGRNWPIADLEQLQTVVTPKWSKCTSSHAFTHGEINQKLHIQIVHIFVRRLTFCQQYFSSPKIMVHFDPPSPK